MNAEKKWADVRIEVTVSFEDDGVNDIRDQALEAAENAVGLFGNESWYVGLEVLQVRDTEMPEQKS